MEEIHFKARKLAGHSLLSRRNLIDKSSVSTQRDVSSPKPLNVRNDADLDTFSIFFSIFPQTLLTLPAKKIPVSILNK